MRVGKTKYEGFGLLNTKTSEIKKYPYIIGWNSKDSEDKAIREQMQLTGNDRGKFIVHELYKKL
jgi:hypothetical protein